MKTFMLHERSINFIEWNKFGGSGHLLATGSKDHVMFICTRSVYPLTFNLNFLTDCISLEFKVREIHNI